jgi:ribosomal protein S18 acetylase RimI-like enzyme
MNRITYKLVDGEKAVDVIKRMVASDFSRPSSSVQTFLDYAKRYRFDVSRQLLAEADNSVIGYALVLINHGATATVFLPEKFSDESLSSFQTVSTNLLKHFISQIDTLDLAIIQAMTSDPDKDSIKPFFSAGFTKLCDLQIMESDGRNIPPSVLIPDTEWVSYSEKNETSFATMIIQTYEETKDCPAINGLRTADEILSGHRYCGIFQPTAWWILRYKHENAGIVLMNSTEEDPLRLELVYMGLMPWARGKGLGKSLLSHGFDLAKKLNKKIIRLAVDNANTPAIELYRKFGFYRVATQTVLVVLNENRRNRLKGK